MGDIEEISSKDSGESELTIVSRAEWGSKKSKFPGLNSLSSPAKYVSIRYYSGKETCWTGEECCPVVRNIQQEHFKKLADIAHNFLIAQDGTIFEGRGWMMESESPDFDMSRGKKLFKFEQNKALQIAYIGNFDEKDAPTAMTQAAKNLIAYGVKNNYIMEKYQFMEMMEPKD